MDSPLDDAFFEDVVEGTEYSAEVAHRICHEFASQLETELASSDAHNVSLVAYDSGVPALLGCDVSLSGPADALETAKRVLKAEIMRLLPTKRVVRLELCPHERGVLDALQGGNEALDRLESRHGVKIDVGYRPSPARVYNIKRSYRHRQGGRRVQLRDGSVTEDLDVQALVNSTDSDMRNTGGAAAAICAASGYALQGFCDEDLRQHGPIRHHCDVRRTGSGSFEGDSGGILKHILNVSPKGHVAAENQAAVYANTYEAVLAYARDNQIRSLAMCPVGCGVLGCTPVNSASALLTALKRVDPDGTLFDTVRVTVIEADGATRNGFLQVFQEQLGSSPAYVSEDVSRAVTDRVQDDDEVLFAWCSTPRDFDVLGADIPEIDRAAVAFTPQSIPLIDVAYRTYCSSVGLDLEREIREAPARKPTSPPFGDLGAVRDAHEMTREQGRQIEDPVQRRYVEYRNRRRWNSMRFFLFRIDYSASDVRTETKFFLLDFEDWWSYSHDDQYGFSFEEGSDTKARGLFCRYNHQHDHDDGSDEADEAVLRERIATDLSREPFVQCRDERSDKQRTKVNLCQISGDTESVINAKRVVERTLGCEMSTYIITPNQALDVATVNEFRRKCEAQGVYFRLHSFRCRRPSATGTRPPPSFFLHGPRGQVKLLETEIISRCGGGNNVHSTPFTPKERVDRAYDEAAAVDVVDPPVPPHTVNVCHVHDTVVSVFTHMANEVGPPQRQAQADPGIMSFTFSTSEDADAFKSMCQQLTRVQLTEF